MLTPVEHDPFASAPSPYAPETPEAATGTLSAYTPSWSDRLRQFVEGAASGAGASKSYSQNLGEGAQGVAGLVPGLGNALSANQAYRDYEGGNYIGAGLNALGALPMPGGMVEGVAAKGAESAAEKEAARIIAYHGSPHTFDQFDLSKIGTGEGAQAYGHGLYFADSEKTARSYRDALAQGQYQFADDRPLGMYDPFAEIASAGQKAGFDYKTANETSQQILQGMRDGDDLGHLQKFVAQSDWDQTEKSAWKAALSEAQKYKWVGDKGSMYQVAINANPDHFLDWDKPLSEHPQAVKDALQMLGIPFEEDWGLSNTIGGKPPVNMRPVTGESAYHKIASQSAAEEQARQPNFNVSSPHDASQALRDAGIPGIKYLDAGSRISDQTQKIVDNYGSRDKALEIANTRLAQASDSSSRVYWGNVAKELNKSMSRNYVVFDDKTIDILKRYGIAGLGLGAGASAFLGQDIPANATTLTPVDYDPFAPQPNPQGAQPVAPPMPGM
jgi:hypothetical protein